jgi:uncharacterized membrane protein
MQAYVASGNYRSNAELAFCEFEEKEVCMRLIQWLGVAVVSMAALAPACGDSGEDDQPSGATCPTGGTALTYANFGSEFISRYCLECHSTTKTGAARDDAPPDVNFDTLDLVKAQAALIDIEAGASPKRTNTSMPPSGERAQPTSDERMKLGEWIACGTPE